MTAARSYQRPVSADAARTELAREAGHQFDPDVVRAFLAVSIGRLRWLVGPVSWMAELPVIRTAAQAPTVTAPATLTAMTLAAVSLLGVVSPPGRSRAVGGPDIVAAAPAPTGPVVAEAPPSDAPVAAVVLGTQIGAGALPATRAPDAATATVVIADPAPSLDAPPTAAPAAACEETGPVSSVVDGAVEPVAGRLAPPLGAAVDQADCGVVVPMERLLVGVLDPSPLAEIVGDLSLLP